MKKYIFLFLFPSIMFAQQLTVSPAGEEYSWGTDPIYFHLNKEAKFPFSDGQWSSKHSVTVSDITWNGMIDTNLVRTDSTFYIYGHVWSTSQIDSLPNAYITGRDSAVVTLEYRKIGYGSNVVSFGAWATYGSAVTIARPVSAADTLLSFLNSTNKPSFPLLESGYIQFRVKVVINKPVGVAYLKGAAGTSNASLAVRRALMNQPNNKYLRIGWVGEVQLTFRRGAI